MLFVAVYLMLVAEGSRRMGEKVAEMFPPSQWGLGETIGVPRQVDSFTGKSQSSCTILPQKIKKDSVVASRFGCLLYRSSFLLCRSQVWYSPGFSTQVAVASQPIPM
jgi:hypothetical protein